MTAAQFDATFPDEEACKKYLQARRWPQGVHCPRCGNFEVHPVKTMPFKWQCYACTPNSGYRFSVIAGTIFENTNKPLRDWFRVVHLMLASKKGMSALQIQRVLGFGSYETALSMCHKIRAALIEPEEKLSRLMRLGSAAKTTTAIGTKRAVAVAVAALAKPQLSVRCRVRAMSWLACWVR
jgi:transposase-like protein